MATLADTPRTQTITLASATAGPFDITLRLFSTDLRVTVNDVETTDFTVIATFADGYEDDATITFDAALEIGDVVVIDPVLPSFRDENYSPTEKNLTSKLNIEFARMWSVLQQFVRDFGRSLKLPSNATQSKDIPAPASGNRVLTSNTDNTGFEWLPVADSGIVFDPDLFARVSNDLSDLADADTALTNLGLSADGRSLVKAANYVAMRGLLSLGDLATQNEADLDASAEVFLAEIDAASDEILIDLSAYSYDSYKLKFLNLEPGGLLTLRTSSDGGTTFTNGASDYAWVNTAVSQASGGGSQSTVLTGDDADREVVLGPSETCEGHIIINRAQAGASRTLLEWELSEFNSSGFTRRFNGAGQRRAATADQDFRIYCDPGTLTGSVILSGIRGA